MKRALLLRSACSLALVGAAIATAAIEPPTEAEPPLAGPKIRDDHPSIVERDMTGNLRPIEFTPERAAAAKLSLDDEARRKFDHIIIAHRERLDRLVADNIDLVIRARTASAGTPALGRAVIIAAALQAFRPALEGPSLWEQISPVLPVAARERFDAMMLEYWDAVFRQATGGREPTTLEKSVICVRQRLEVLGEEIRLAVDGLGNSGPLIVRAMTSGLSLSPSQRDRLSEIARDFDTATLHQPSGDDHKRLLLQVCAALDEDQRKVVLSRVPR
ncbi:MAG: hypothetical protein IT432_09255 [Phycisphaerales bacterium]|nr:hypothetical protein [Phycisphaerales bacterium]